MSARRYVIIGAGAVGAALAAGLDEAGRDVVLVSRRATHRTIREQGLRFIHDGRERVLSIETAGDPSEVELHEDDVLVLATKTQDAAAALSAWAHRPVGDRIAGDVLPVVTVQNGLDAERSALRSFATVISGTTLIGAVHVSVGVVEVRNAPRVGQLILGSEPSSGAAGARLVPQIAADLRAAGWLVHETSEPRRWKAWKMLLSVVFPVDVLAGSAAERDELGGLLRDEAAHVLRRSGYEVVDPRGELSYDPVEAAIPPGVGKGRLSTWQSFERGSGSEVDYLTGEIVLRARLLGIAVPASTALQSALAAAEAAGEGPGVRLIADVLADARARAAVTPDEAPAALLARYGGAAPAAAAEPNDTISLLYRHRSVRRFTAEPVDDIAVTTIIAAAQSAATSSNLQSWSVVEIRDPERKTATSVLAGDQAFIREAPVFLVFIADWARNRQIALSRGEPAEGIGFVDTTLTGFVDAALAAQNAVVAAESLGLGTVYVGSVRNNPEPLSDLLGLPEGAFPVVGLALGHPDPTDTAGVKPRLRQEVIRHTEAYTVVEDAEIDGYDDRVAAYYAGQGATRGWVTSVLARVRGAASLHGRHELRASLERRGLHSR